MNLSHKHFSRQRKNFFFLFLLKRHTPVTHCLGSWFASTHPQTFIHPRFAQKITKILKILFSCFGGVLTSKIVKKIFTICGKSICLKKDKKKQIVERFEVRLCRTTSQLNRILSLLTQEIESSSSSSMILRMSLILACLRLLIFKSGSRTGIQSFEKLPELKNLTKLNLQKSNEDGPLCPQNSSNNLLSDHVI